MSTLDREYFNLKSKVSLFITEIKEILSDDFPYDDSKNAAHILLSRAEKLSSRIDQFPKLKGDTRNSIALDAYKLISRSSSTLGIIARSGTNRNAFEMYEPFRELASQFFNTDSVSLILSSEWNFVPFTFPMNLEELPRFIVIGLPASESDNILMFPTAGHELGHSIWRQSGHIQTLSRPLRIAIEKAIERDKSLLTDTFPNTKKKEFDSDLFGKQLRDHFSNVVFAQTSRQLEEIFCDFVGIGIFGKSYLHAFEYIISPGMPNRSTGQYPDVRDRADIINREAHKKGCGLPGYETSFTAAKNLDPTLMLRAVTLSDNLRGLFLDEISRLADQVLTKAKVPLPQQKDIDRTKEFFLRGVPVGNESNIGTLVSAAWETILGSEKEKIEGAIEKTIRHVTDLVLKSVEANEFNKWRI